MTEGLIHFCMEGDLDGIKEIIERFKNEDIINSFGYEGETPLEAACLSGNLDVVKYLIDHGAKIKFHHSSPLAFACKGGHFEIVKYLVDYISNVYTRYVGNFDINEKYDGKPALMHLFPRHIHETQESKENDLRIVKYLNDHGADINAKDNNRDTLLMYACGYEDLEIMRYLIENGADVNCVNKHGMTPLLTACSRNKFPLIEYLIEHGADVNYVNDREVTPLLIACAGKEFAIVKYLVEHGADVNHKNSVKCEYNNHAWRRGDEDLYKPENFLAGIFDNEFEKDRKKSINKIPGRGRTVLMYACEGGNLETIDYLISLGADLNARDDFGRTPLMYACYTMNLDLIKHLLDLCDASQINEKDDLGRTPLMIAFYNSKLNIIKHLIDRGADTNIKDALGRGIDVYAREYSYPKLDKYLSEKGINLL